MKTTRHLLAATSAILLLMAPLMVHAEEKLEQPILISSAGQSADMKLVGMLAKKQELDAKMVNMATVADLEGIKTLIFVPGFSSKGLGAAGVSQKDEMDRVVKLVDAAKEKKIPIVTIHIGGMARRKGQSDSFNKLVAEASRNIIVVKQGDEDSFFSDIAKAGKIPMESVEKIADVAEPLGKLFK